MLATRILKWNGLYPHMFPNACAWPSAKMHHKPVHILRTSPEPSVWIKDFGILTKYILIEMNDSRAHPNTASPREEAAADGDARRGHMSRHRHAHAGVHPKTLLATGDKIRHLNGLGVFHGVAESALRCSRINLCHDLVVCFGGFHQII